VRRHKGIVQTGAPGSAPRCQTPEEVGKGTDVRKGVGYALVVLAVAAALLGLSFALFAGGHEADALRVAGFELLLLAAGMGIAGALILRSRR
jgi:hypothetical protein